MVPDIYGIQILITAVACLFLAVICLFNNPRSRLNLYLSATIFFIAMWQVDLFLLRTAESAEAAERISKIFRPSIFFTVYFWYKFYTLFTGADNRFIRFFNKFLLISTAGISILNYLGVGFGGCAYKPGKGYFPVPDCIYAVFIFNFAAAVIVGFKYMIQKYVSEIYVKSEKRQIEYFFLGTVIVVLGAVSNILNIYGMEVFPAAGFSVLVFSLMLTIAVVSYDLLKLRELFQKVFMYALAAAMILGIFIILETSLFRYPEMQSFRIPVYFITAFLTVISINPTLDMLDSLTRKALFISHYDYQSLLQFVVNQIRGMKDTGRVLRSVNINVKEILKVRVSLIYIWSHDKKQYAGYDAEGNNVPDFNEFAKTAESLYVGRKVVRLKEIEDKINYDIAGAGVLRGELEKISGFMKSIRAELIIPVSINEETGGFWFVGDRIKENAFHAGEIRWLENLADQLAVIIENILLYERLLGSERLVMLGRMAAAVAHEIRNPLTGMSGLVQIISANKKKRDRVFDKFLEIAPGEFKRLEKLTENLLDLSHTTKINKQQIDIHEMIREVNNFVSYAYKSNHVEVKTDFSGSGIISADKERVRQVILNVIINAVQSLGGGGGRIEITTCSGGFENREYFMVKIWDSGSGISEEIKSRIFEPFFTSKAEGTGLGLAISKNIMEAHGGFIKACSEDEGCAFIIGFPE